MTDRVGSLAFPVPVPSGPADGVGDPALVAIAAFAQAALNEKGDAAWRALVPVAALGPDYERLATKGLVFDPQDLSFNEADLPAIYAYRGTEKQDSNAGDFLTTTSEVVLWWVYAPAIQEDRRQRFAFQNAVRKILLQAFHLGRTPSWAASDDADVSAPTFAADPDAVKLAFATSAAPQVYSGAALDGVVGQATISPKRAVTITGSGNPAAFVADSAITIVGESVLGDATTWVLHVPHVVTVPFSPSIPNDCQKVTSVSFAAQASNAGTWTVGLAARAGLGTEIYGYASLVSCNMKRATSKKLSVEVDGDVRSYDMVEVAFDVAERLRVDPAGFPSAAQTAIATTLTNGTFTDAAVWPDAGA